MVLPKPLLDCHCSTAGCCRAGSAVCYCSTAVGEDDSATESNGPATTRSDSDTDMDDESPPDFNSSPFAEGEKALAFHSCHIYEAKVQKVDFQQKKWTFSIHYLGWNKSWDECVGVDRLLKYTEENLNRQKANNKRHGLDKISREGRSSQVKPKSSNCKTFHLSQLQ